MGSPDFYRSYPHRIRPITCVSTLQLSDLDARVIDELLSDPAFLESLLEKGVELGQGDDDSVGGMEGNSTIASSSRSVLAPAGEVTSAPKSSGYESVTMQVVEELQDSVKGILAKVSAAFESAGVNSGRSMQLETISSITPVCHNRQQNFEAEFKWIAVDCCGSPLKLNIFSAFKSVGGIQ